MVTKLPSTKESLKLRNRLDYALPNTTRKSSKRDSLNSEEELVSLRLVVLPKLKLVRSRTESLMLSALLKLPLKKVSSLVVVALCSMPPNHLIP